MEHPRTCTARTTTSDPESGVAILISLFFLIVVGGLVSSGTLLMKASTDRAEVRFRRNAQADQFARSGLTEALSWIRRQTTQPVTAFEPKLDMTPAIAITDTEEPDVGLVREFAIGDDIHGRYEVWKQWDADPDPQRLAFRKQYQCTDLSKQRGHSAAGAVWQLRSLGYVFQRRDPTKAFNEAPNRVLAFVALECEAQRPVITLPTQAALSARKGGKVQVGKMGKIDGNGVAAIGQPSGSGIPSLLSGGVLFGSPTRFDASSYADSIKAVLGVTDSELRAMADVVVNDPSQFPDPIPEYAIVFCDCGPMTFSAKRSLNGTGLVFIRGDTDIVSGNNSVFNGLLYIEGSLVQRETSAISGAVVVTGGAQIEGSGTEAEIQHDSAVLESVTRNVGIYRWASALRPINSTE